MKMKSMRWIKFRSNGKFHLITDSRIADDNQKLYWTACERVICADPDKVVARDEIYKSGIDEYCLKCLEVHNEKS